jgi:exodeoxyribonuclease V alpha subunit
VDLPSPLEWVLALGGSPLCTDGSSPSPLVLDSEARLYLARYHRYQTELAVDLRRRAQARTSDIVPDALQDGLQRLFPSKGPRPADPRQRLAAVIALLRRLTVISGGPGTGKTSTVARILALLVEQALAAGRPPPRMHLLAPTGKAAARLIEAISASLTELDCTATVKAAIVTEASTIHRRLGFRPSTPTRFFHDASNLLPTDMVLVDEASMVDLALMAKLVRAIPRSARLILLGDKDQLASVEAGAILGDICNTTGSRTFSTAFTREIQGLLGDSLALDAAQTGPEQTGVWDCVVELTHSYRFDEGSGIGRLARAVGEGRGEDALLQLAESADEIELVPLDHPGQLRTVLRQTVISAFTDYLLASDPAERLQRLGTYRLLSAHRRGPLGTQRLNVVIEQLLAAAGLIRPSSAMYDGRPIMVTHNDYQLELFNGDVGVLCLDESGALRAFFAGKDGKLRSLLPARLPPHESVYAMTVHKSQGSEFDRVGLLIPPQLSPVLTRELVYTGVTRARKRVTLYGNAQVLIESMRRRIERASGLRDALWEKQT